MNFSSWVTPYDNLTDGYWHLLATQNLHFPSTHSLPKTSTTEVVSKTTSPLCGPWSFTEHWKLNPSRRLPIRKPSRVDQIVATLSCQDEKISKLGLINVNICELPISPWVSHSLSSIGWFQIPSSLGDHSTMFVTSSWFNSDVWWLNSRVWWLTSWIRFIKFWWLNAYVRWLTSKIF